MTKEGKLNKLTRDINIEVFYTFFGSPYLKASVIEDSKIQYMQCSFHYYGPPALDCEKVEGNHLWNKTLKKYHYLDKGYGFRTYHYYNSETNEQLLYVCD